MIRKLLTLTLGKTNSPHIEKANKIAIIETCQINALRPCFECKYQLPGSKKDFTIQSYLNELFLSKKKSVKMDERDLLIKLFTSESDVL